MPPASGTLIKCDLPPRNGKRRSIALEIEKSSRVYRLRAKDYSRDKPVVAKSLGIKCPDDVYTEEEALAHLKDHPEAWLFFQGIKEQMEEGIWPKELRQTVTSTGRSAVSRAFPHGSLGDGLRWYLKAQGIGAERQKLDWGSTAREILTLEMQRHEAFAHLDTSDLQYTHVQEMFKQWQLMGKSIHTFRNGLVLLSAGLNQACDRPELTGCRRGPDYGIVQTEKMNLPSNPFNTLRREIQGVIAQNRMDDPDKGPDPFDHEEARAILTVFRKSSRLRPYWPLVALCLATGARPNELCALPWSNVLGLWKGFTMRSRDFLWDESSRQLTGRPVMLSRAVCKYNARHLMRSMRFKNTKNQNERRPKLNNYIPGYENLFGMAIDARLPSRLEITNLEEFRDMLVFQGPRAISSRQSKGETREQYTQHNTHRPMPNGAGSSRTAELHRAASRSATGHLTHSAGVVTEQHRLTLEDRFLPFDWHNFGRYWKEALDLAEIRHRSPYQMRHTYVSLMSYAGHTDAEVASWIGDTEQTMKARYQGRILTGNLD